MTSPFRSTFFAPPPAGRRHLTAAVIEADDIHFARVMEAMAEHHEVVQQRLRDARRRAGSSGQEGLDRDLEIHRLSARLRVLERADQDLCLGRMTPVDGGSPLYLGRVGLSDVEGRRLLLDWRTPAAAPFFAATTAEPCGLSSRRRYRWRDGRVLDFWDEVLTPGGDPSGLAPDEQSAFLADLGRSRQVSIRDVLGTIQADQDAAIRADSRGALVVDGGPGTGKTVVALHRAAYLQYSDPRLSTRPEGVLVVGPHRPYLNYVADVLPGLSEEGVRTVTLQDPASPWQDAPPESDAEVARLKSSLPLVAGIETGVRWYQEAPTRTVDLETPWGEVTLGPAQWQRAFAEVDAAVPHNHAREQIWEALADVAWEQLDAQWVDEPRLSDPQPLRPYLQQEGAVRRLVERGWPLLEPTDLVADLWSVPAFLRLCVPGLTGEQVELLQREQPSRWTQEDLPLLDAARHLLGDPQRVERRRRRGDAAAAQREYMDQVVSSLVQADWDGEGEVTMLRGEDLREVLADEDGVEQSESESLAGPFTHIVVDEAQELTDAQWQMLVRRCPSRSFTIVGDRAQARAGFTETWDERLARVGVPRSRTVTLHVNYRTPREVMEVAATAIRAVLPQVQVPTSVRSSGRAVQTVSPGEVGEMLASWVAERPDGSICLIAEDAVVTEDLRLRIQDWQRQHPALRLLTPELAKGLEFDLVLVLDPDSWGAGETPIAGERTVAAAVDRYVAMTRATQHLVIVRSG